MYERLGISGSSTMLTPPVIHEIYVSSFMSLRWEGGLKVKVLYQNDTFLTSLMSCEAELLSPAIVFATSFTKLGIPELLRKVHICHIKLPFYINNRIKNKQCKHNFSWVLEKSLFNLMSTLIYNRVLNSYKKLSPTKKERIWSNYKATHFCLRLFVIIYNVIL